MNSGLFGYKTMKINEDFIYILRYWPKYSMLSTVTATMDTPDLSQFYSPKFRCEVPAASSSYSASLTSCQFQLLS